MAKGEQAVKMRAACEEFRAKKSKCTGEQPACSRCERENIRCVYGLQKSMGRPKKRQKADGHPTAVASQHRQISEARLDSLDLDLSDSGIYGDHAYIGANDIPRTLDPSSDWPTMSLEETMPEPTVDTTNLECQAPAPSSCACLSTMYLTLNDLQAMGSPLIFPFALHPLREAMRTASHVLVCARCPHKFITALQNTQLLGTLLVSVAERFSKVLESINTEALRADAAGETKKFRLSDLNSSTSYLHTGGLGCAAAFQIDLSPTEWRAMTKKVVLAEIYGPVDGNSCCPYFLDLTQNMRDRQNRWHQAETALPEDLPRSADGALMGGNAMSSDGHVCLKMVLYAETLVKGFDWLS